MKHRTQWLFLVLWTVVSAADLNADVPSPRPNILFCIADDWSWPHAGAYGDRVVKTPAFDRVAREGVLFRRAFCSSPSCTPSRGAILTGQSFSRLEEGGNLWSTLQKKFAVYPDLLEAAGYHVGLQGKGWGPGDFKVSGWTRNPAGPPSRSFADFLVNVPDGKPFCFWFGSSDPHRPYETGSGEKSGMSLGAVTVPPHFPDVPEVRRDMLDYYFEVERFDRDVGAMLALLEKAGKLDNTIVVITSDNGMPFPRCKTNLYDSGARMPLAIRWPAHVKGGRVIEDFVSHTDYAPTFLEAAGLKPPPEMTGRSLMPLLASKKAGQVDSARDKVFFGRERHARSREGNVGYPARAVRTDRYLYIRNFAPDRWPAGDPVVSSDGDPKGYGDCDGFGSLTKQYLLDHRDDAAVKPLFALSFDKRPAEELYDLRRDPNQLSNVASDRRHAKAFQSLRADLDRWMRDIADPRAMGSQPLFDSYPYYSKPPKQPPPTP